MSSVIIYLQLIYYLLNYTEVKVIYFEDMWKILVVSSSQTYIQVNDGAYRRKTISLIFFFVINPVQKYTFIRSILQIV